jgi:hypothetical protein
VTGSRAPYDYATARAMKAGSREAAQIASALPVLRRVQATGTPDVPTVCLQAGLVERGWRRGARCSTSSRQT